MNKTSKGSVVSIVGHVVIIAAIFFAQNLFQEKPVRVIDFTIAKTTLPEPAKKTPVQPHVISKQRSPVVDKKEVFPDTAKPDTVHPSLVIAAEPAATVSEPALPVGSHSVNVIDSTVLKKEYITAQYGVIRDKVYRALSYPAYAQEEGWQGTVKMGFLVNPDGSVDNVHVLKSSGYALLDNNAVKAVRQAAPFPYAPVKLQIVLPVVYRLE